MATAPRECSNPDCSFDQDGRCAENENPETCHFRVARPLILADDEGETESLPSEDRSGGEEVEDHDRDIRDDEFSEAMIALPSGLRMSIVECAAAMSIAPTRVISFIAPQDAGKTSLIASIYEMFLEGRQSGALFRGSRTVPGFEQLCHLSRAASGRTEGGMQRTRRAEGLGYFHLDLIVGGTRIGMLLGDRPGESYVHASASIEDANDLRELRSASTLVYLIDGKVLVDPMRKSLPRGQAISVLDAIVEAGLVRGGPALAVVLTKADLVQSSGDPVGFERFEKIVDDLRERYAGRFHSVTGYRTAASPTPATEEYPRGAGVVDLFRDLLSDNRSPLSAPVSARKPHRSFQALGLRR